MIRRLLLVTAMLAVPAWAASSIAQDTREVESALARVTAEQQSVYQQFQMVQVMLRSEEAKTQPLPTYTPPATPPNYEDVIREQNARTTRIKQYQDEQDRLYSRYRDLETQRAQLVQALSALAQQRGEGK